MSHRLVAGLPGEHRVEYCGPLAPDPDLRVCGPPRAWPPLGSVDLAPAQCPCALNRASLDGRDLLRAPHRPRDWLSHHPKAAIPEPPSPTELSPAEIRLLLQSLRDRNTYQVTHGLPPCEFGRAIDRRGDQVPRRDRAHG